MSDIFISYATEDRERAREIAQALIERGWTVWWDREIPIGRSYTDVIEQELATAGCVVVLWSKESVRKPWVHNEAREGYARHVLVPVLIDDVRPPLEFRHLQTASLVDWEPGSDSADFAAVEEAIAAFVRRDGASAPAPPPLPRAVPRHRSSKKMVLAASVAAVVLVALLLALWLTPRNGTAVDVPLYTSDATTGSTSTEGSALPPAGTSPAEESDPAAEEPQDGDVRRIGSGVGKVLVEGQPRCTAFLVSRTRVLMPGPCARMSPARGFEFLLGHFSDSERGTRYGARLITSASGSDSFAVLELDRPAAAAFVPLEVRQLEANVGEKIVVVHYGPDSPLRINRTRVKEVREDAIFYMLRTELASMGAPIVAATDNAVLGMHWGRDARDPYLKRAVPSTAIPPSIVAQLR